MVTMAHAMRASDENATFRARQETVPTLDGASFGPPSRLLPVHTPGWRGLNADVELSKLAGAAAAAAAASIALQRTVV